MLWTLPTGSLFGGERTSRKSKSSYLEFLNQFFPHVATHPLSARHVGLWDWFESLSEKAPPPPAKVDIWPRGGAKSSTAELGVTYVGFKLTRRFCLYVSGTQDQADMHVQSIATLFERVGIERQVGKYGNSKGWRRNQLRTSTGFNVAAIGLDTAARGIKLDEFRPDLIIFDDIDGTEDTAKTTAKKQRAITKQIIPAGSSNCASLFIQNLIIEDGIFAQLYDGRADFLRDRTVCLQKAVDGLKVETYLHENGSNKYRIVEGVPTWSGQSLDVCEKQINEWGLRAFLQEAQHEVESVQGYFFDEKQFSIVNEVPELLRVCRAWDYAATQGGGDFTVGVLMGIAKNDTVYVLDVVRAQLSSDNVEKLVSLISAWDRSRGFANYTLRVPQDPGSAGKRAANEDAKRFGAKADPVTGKKATRAKGWAEKVNIGNARLLLDNKPRTPEIDTFLESVTRGTELEGKTLEWNRAFMSEHRKFREDETHDFDDQVDAGSDAFNELAQMTNPHDW